MLGEQDQTNSVEGVDNAEETQSSENQLEIITGEETPNEIQKSETIEKVDINSESDSDRSNEQETQELERVEENQENQEIISVQEFDNEYSFTMLTPDVIIRILSFLDVPDIVYLQLVSTDWFAYCRCDALWSVFYETTDWTLSPPEMELGEATWYDLYRLHYEKEIRQLSKFASSQHFYIPQHKSLVT